MSVHGQDQMINIFTRERLAPLFYETKKPSIGIYVLSLPIFHDCRVWIWIIPLIKLQHQLPDLENYQLWKLQYRQPQEPHQACPSKVELEQHKGTELQ